MTEQFEDQGGFATSDPSPLMRWLTSRVMTRLFKPERIEKRRVAAERQRRKEGSPHRVEYFHQIDDGYSHLAAQKLAALGARYDVELQCHLVNGPRGKNVAEPELLDRLSRYDAHQIAPAYGLEFPAEVDAPAADLQQQARAILAGQSPTARVALVAPVSHAVWQGDWQALAALAAEHGCASDADTAAALAAGDERRAALKHYSGAMFYCAGEWYWGVDRLYHLEQRLAGLALDRRAGEPLLAPRQEPDWGDVRDNGSLDPGTLCLTAQSLYRRYLRSGGKAGPGCRGQPATATGAAHGHAGRSRDPGEGHVYLHGRRSGGPSRWRSLR